MAGRSRVRLPPTGRRYRLGARPAAAVRRARALGSLLHLLVQSGAQGRNLRLGGAAGGSLGGEGLTRLVGVGQERWIVEAGSSHRVTGGRDIRWRGLYAAPSRPSHLGATRAGHLPEQTYTG